MRPADVVGMVAAVFLANLAARAAQGVKLPPVPALCWRHGWVDSPCERCKVWEDPPYRSDLARADRAEAAAIRRLEVATHGEQPEDR